MKPVHACNKAKNAFDRAIDELDALTTSQYNVRQLYFVGFVMLSRAAAEPVL